MPWHNSTTQRSLGYVCGHCGHEVASNIGWNCVRSGYDKGDIRICHFCDKPTFFDSPSGQHPGANYGESIESLEDLLIKNLYEEARRCMSVSAYTAVSLLCRKLLMHVAVDKGAEENLQFVKYVDYLQEKNWVSPAYKDWVDLIRTKGNEATHEIVQTNREEAESLLDFTAILLKTIYEYPLRAKAFKK